MNAQSLDWSVSKTPTTVTNRDSLANESNLTKLILNYYSANVQD